MLRERERGDRLYSLCNSRYSSFSLDDFSSALLARPICGGGCAALGETLCGGREGSSGGCGCCADDAAAAAAVAAVGLPSALRGGSGGGNDDDDVAAARADGAESVLCKWKSAEAEEGGGGATAGRGCSGFRAVDDET